VHFKTYSKNTGQLIVPQLLPWRWCRNISCQLLPPPAHHQHQHPLKCRHHLQVRVRVRVRVRVKVKVLLGEGEEAESSGASSAIMSSSSSWYYEIALIRCTNIMQIDTKRIKNY
jgi:hypothetical protein